MNLLFNAWFVIISLWRENPIKELNIEVGSTMDTKSAKKGAGRPNRIRADPKKILPLIIVPRK